MESFFSQRQSPATITSCWASGTPGLLISSPAATKVCWDTIGWLRTDFPENRNEQGGIMVGRYFRDSCGVPIRAEVYTFLKANTSHRFPGYIEWDAMEEIRLQAAFFEMKEHLSKSDPILAEELAIIGWWHTHPNNLPVFMSETDMETQRLKYYKPEKYSLVINPHKGVFRAFIGRDAVEVPIVMLTANEAEKETRSFQTHSTCRSQREKPAKRKKKSKKHRRSKKRK